MYSKKETRTKKEPLKKCNRILDFVVLGLEVVVIHYLITHPLETKKKRTDDHRHNCLSVIT